MRLGRVVLFAVMTVVVVLEFTAGATLCKGLNRGLGTLLAGLLALLIECVSNASGRSFQAVFIGAAVFIIDLQTTLFDVPVRYDGKHVTTLLGDVDDGRMLQQGGWSPEEDMLLCEADNKDFVRSSRRWKQHAQIVYNY